MIDSQEHQEIAVDLVEEGEDAGEVAVDVEEVEEAVVVR
jgi:rRNA 2'-O-methyltransferase fibrillarin